MDRQSTHAIGEPILCSPAQLFVVIVNGKAAQKLIFFCKQPHEWLVNHAVFYSSDKSENFEIKKY